MAEEKTETHMLEWFEKEVIPDLATKGKFGSKFSKVNSLKWEISERNTDHFASCPYFAQLTVQNDNKEVKDLYIVAKFMTQSVAVRAGLQCTEQFYNEMVFYNEVIPTFKEFLKQKPNVPSSYLSDVCPECFHAHIDLENPDYGIIVLNDLRRSDFRTAVSKVELDLEHCLVTVRKLAKFHAISYAMKIEKAEDFKKLTTKYIECRYEDDKYKSEATGYFLKTSALRGIAYLEQQENCEVPADYLKSLRQIFDSSYTFMQNMIVPEEPIATICHGDFCRNNILYRLDQGKAVDCRLFDYQTFRYGNPSIDLTFFIYMNTTLELREKHFNEIFSAYYTTLLDNISLLTSKSKSELMQTYKIELFQDDFVGHALYAYLTVAFFLPMMMAPTDESIEDTFSKNTPQEMAEKVAEQGGAVVTERIAEVIIHIYRLASGKVF